MVFMPPNGNKSGPDQLLGLGEFVRRRRRANSLTQAQLALLAHVGRRFVSDLENGKATLALDKVDLVLKVFGKRLGLVDREREELGPEPETASLVAETPTAKDTRRG
jgi:y4mF family transcriptional regulator